MSDFCYKPIIEKFVWSYSRVTSYNNCPYGFFMKYLTDTKKESKFFSSYGAFMHEIIEQFYEGNLSKEDMLLKYLTEFSFKVVGDRPKETVVERYIRDGINYLKGFTPLPFDLVDVEKTINFDFAGEKFVGIIDYVGKKDGNLVIVDNKSRALKQRSNRKKPTLNDIELDNYFRQLYVYAEACKQAYGEYPKYLYLNCFRVGELIKEEFSLEKLVDTERWVKRRIEKIKDAENFYPQVEYFMCTYLCDVSSECCYREYLS